MLRRVPQIVLYCGVAAACFFLGERIEPWLLGAAPQRAAEARGLATGTPVPLAVSPLLNSGPIHNDAIQAGATPSSPAIVELQPALSADSVNGTDDKPTTISGKNPENDAEFVEMRNQPEVQGEGKTQGEIDSTPARDVDMIGDEGLPAADTLPSDTKSSN